MRDGDLSSFMAVKMKVGGFDIAEFRKKSKEEQLFEIEKELNEDFIIQKTKNLGKREASFTEPGAIIDPLQPTKKVDGKEVDNFVIYSQDSKPVISTKTTDDNDPPVTIPDYVYKMKLPMTKSIGASNAKSTLLPIDLDKLQEVLSKPPANIKVDSFIETAGRKGTVFTKTIDGADRDITIYDNATVEEVRAQLEFLETGKSKSPEVNVEKLDFTL
jgi:hypothetical protein